MALANLSIYYTWKNIKSVYMNNKFKISAPAWNDEFDILMDHILLQRSKTFLNLSSRKIKH